MDQLNRCRNKQGKNHIVLRNALYDVMALTLEVYIHFRVLSLGCDLGHHKCNVSAELNTEVDVLELSQSIAQQATRDKCSRS